ncbi:hypothetical protein ACFB49_27290 [Sphingomonas sp. DBB INV C78]|uniref:hypothetical protein n=1 Tax=Sphingomonas sp. DBB INV C78 TaxID=3349434 RepID=UPI0036D35B84
MNFGNRWVQIRALREATANSSGEIFFQGSLDDPNLDESLPIVLCGTEEEGCRVAWRGRDARDDFGSSRRAGRVTRMSGMASLATALPEKTRPATATTIACRSEPLWVGGLGLQPILSLPRMDIIMSGITRAPNKTSAELLGAADARRYWQTVGWHSVDALGRLLDDEFRLPIPEDLETRLG